MRIAVIFDGNSQFYEFSFKISAISFFDADKYLGDNEMCPTNCTLQTVAGIRSNMIRRTIEELSMLILIVCISADISGF